MDQKFKQEALDYHQYPKPGKLTITPTKRMATQRDLSLAYSPGVAAPCLEIQRDPSLASKYTARGNLVAVISNGTAVLGLGNIGALAGKPVMEGKAVLFKKFAGIDVFDIEVDATDPEHFCNVVAALEPTFGGINLEDIKAPECFEIEKNLQSRMSIPVFHDDQHGTAIVVTAALVNALRIQNKKLEDVKLVTSGAGAAAMACVDLMVGMGLKVENVTLTDIDGVVWKGRDPNMPENMARYAKETNARKLQEVINGADIFLGLSAAGVLKPEYLEHMAPKPIILALANPEPEITPNEVKKVRTDAIIATGRSDYPNQVNNVLCFPFIFRGALDVGAKQINEEMQHAAVYALAQLATLEANEAVIAAYGGDAPSFGSEYILPKPFDPRLILHIAPAVAKAAMDSGVATQPIEDFQAYTDHLQEFVFRSSQVMQPVFEAVRRQPELKKIVFSEGESGRVLRAIQTLVNDKLAKPYVIGNKELIQAKINSLGLSLRVDEHVGVFEPNRNDPLLQSLEDPYKKLVERQGIPPSLAYEQLYRRKSVMAAMLLREGHVDVSLIGGYGEWYRHFKYLKGIIPRRPDVKKFHTISALIQSNVVLFMGDAYLNLNPSAEEIAELTLLAAEAVSKFGLPPRAALLSYSSFGTGKSGSAQKMREALEMIKSQDPQLEIDGEMQGDAALSPTVRNRLIDDSPLTGNANLLIMPCLDSANIGLSLSRVVGDALQIGPITLGATKPLHILTESTTARGIVNLAMIAIKQSL
ncbi:EutD and phosphobutyryltransferase) (Pta) (PDB:1QZT) (PUBMED:28754323) [Commensalibacter communis]|uniref:EutD and phosphobutyryltransferase (Pta (PDB:1QZT (PUBMED:28754323 n=1 Tax=Commensalibacter communis TaxID=2972786 RepID=A0A9W4X7L1_9PROT|nr:NADP-dependent malic enzyme [Commensalibacter communis]CAI3954627.1 EutD and phosphobutyryltransferase) (Pta) (PDB:1QZT) (PUBMED:28754323) [Commensalibacter communis]CAI3955516.1 EutD and phosphobutyryltransferase) (Pta) (PDB:1QZT) (PUBMED:28754323) [Commensalibacter communis]CAI3955883.1 EutD and phosphobutyryltransferase) (Pta) (PDB:1QZT) (PUBMED:28754323) [Commensalibacter communis]CAI3956875.1 EutD and phosphobutyryltransferase) (Pta) (PDB:1QZT) (PUBMED:28754323) [Commensalibacter commun